MLATATSFTWKGYPMDLSLEGRRVLVTGGSKGIGLACARAFTAEKAQVAICSRSESNLAAARQILPESLTFAADLTDAAAAAAMVQAVEERLGPIDILVNCAGAARRTPPAELTPTHWRAAMDAKFFTYLNVIDPTVKRMAIRRAGVIVNVIGNGGKIASPVHLAGGAANAALMLATAGLATGYASAGIRVVGVNPGLTDTDRVDEGLASTARLEGIGRDEARAQAIARIPLGRMAEPEEIADVVVFFASRRASYVTGVTLTMDGAGTPCVV